MELRSLDADDIVESPPLCLWYLAPHLFDVDILVVVVVFFFFFLKHPLVVLVVLVRICNGILHGQQLALDIAHRYVSPRSRNWPKRDLHPDPAERVIVHNRISGVRRSDTFLLMLRRT